MFGFTMASFGRALVQCAIGSGILLVAGCGGSNAATAPSQTPAPASTTRVLYEGSGALAVRILKFFTLNIPIDGTVGVTVDWTSSANSVWIYFARGSDPCTVEQLNAGQCPFISQSETTAKPKTLTLPNLAAGAYTLYVGNRGPTDESFSFQVTLTSTSRATAASTPRVSGAGPMMQGQWTGLVPAFR